MMNKSNIFTINKSMKKIIHAFDTNNEKSLNNDLGEEIVHILKKWWTTYKMVPVKITGDIWSHCGEETILKHTEKAEIKSTDKILDLGCGIGGPARIIAEKYNCKIQGIDLDTEAIEVAKAITKLEGLENLISYNVCDRENLIFENETFDIIWEHAGFGSELQRANTWKESLRVLKNGGKIVSVIEPKFLEQIVNLGISEVTYYSYYTDLRKYNIKKFVSALESNKEEIINRTGETNYFAWYNQKLSDMKRTELPSYKIGLVVAIK
jgi:ubiquinone/menaquinone biosynthesis C-methylase UbiE